MSIAFYVLVLSIVSWASAWAWERISVTADPSTRQRISDLSIIGIFISIILAYWSNFFEVVTHISSAEPATTLYVVQAIGVVVFPIGILIGYF